MNRIDPHAHYLPDLDDGCATAAQSLACFRLLVDAGYNRAFCTPHCCSPKFVNPAVAEVKRRVDALSALVKQAGIPIELRPGGELRLSPEIAETLPKLGIPTFGHAGKYVLADLWDEDWPTWAVRAVEWLQGQGYTVIIAHPERMPANGNMNRPVL